MRSTVTTSESPAISSIGSVIARIASCDHVNSSASSVLSFETSVVKASGSGATLSQASSIGVPANISGLIEGNIAHASGWMPALENAAEAATSLRATP